MIRPFPISAALAVFVLTATANAQPGRGDYGGGGQRIEPKDLEFKMGVAEVLDRTTYDKLSYQGPDVGRDPYLAGIQYVKFIIDSPKTDAERVYFMNTKNYRAHPPYMRMVGVRNGVRGAISYMPRLKTPDGGAGLYVFDFQPNDAYTFEQIQYIRDVLVAKSPILKGKLAFHPLRGNMARYQQDKEKYDASDVPVHLDDDLYANIAYLPLNPAESFGLLRVMGDEARPSPRDIVICKTLPNQMPRVAGVISEERQTPLSHVNLRAVQDKIPNAYIQNALKQKKIDSLIGKLVHYQVTAQGYSLREATQDEVDRHFAAFRPAEPQTPSRDLSAKEIRPLAKITFQQSKSYGVKTANLAAMHTFEMPAGLIPEGHGAPFYFYDEFMKHNGFYQVVVEMLNDKQFQADRDVRQAKLKGLRDRIEKADMPGWMMDALAEVQKTFPEGASIRCRSSTNNEDLPGFSGAGLYDSFTHKPSEGHLSKSIKQVYASLWNHRAYEERAFHRIDHLKTAMGVLLHENQKGERANGVAVTDDVLYETEGNYYLNTQIGEDLVTNPNADSSPEEVLLGWWERDGYQIVRRSAQAAADGTLLSRSQFDELRKRLGRIHSRFAKLYGFTLDDQFAMEIEYKITKEGKLLIKQARPWVY